MMTLALFLSQAVAPALPSFAIPEGLISTGVSGMVLYLWREDRKTRAEDQKRVDEERKAERTMELDRYEKLSMEFRTIVQENTEAIVKLTEKISKA